MYTNTSKNSASPKPTKGPSFGALSRGNQKPPLIRKKTIDEDRAEKEKAKIFALETIGNLLEVVNDKGEEEKILRSFMTHYGR